MSINPKNPSPALPETEREQDFFPPHRGEGGGQFDFCSLVYCFLAPCRDASALRVSTEGDGVSYNTSISALILLTATAQFTSYED